MGFLAAIFAVALAFSCATATVSQRMLLPSACRCPFHCEVSFPTSSDRCLDGLLQSLDLAKTGRVIMVGPDITGDSHHGCFVCQMSQQPMSTRGAKLYNWKAPVLGSSQAPLSSWCAVELLVTSTLCRRSQPSWTAEVVTCGSVEGGSSIL